MINVIEIFKLASQLEDKVNEEDCQDALDSESKKFWSEILPKEMLAKLDD